MVDINRNLTLTLTLKQNWMQGWHYGKGVILLEGYIFAKKISLPQGQNFTERQHLLAAPKIWSGKRNQSVIFTRCMNLCIQTVFPNANPK